MTKTAHIAALAAAALLAWGPAHAQNYNTCSGYNSSLNWNGVELLGEAGRNPAATVAVASTIGGLMGFLNENMSSDMRNMMGAAGVVGALWCISSSQNQRVCSDTALRLGSLMAERQQLQSGFNSYSCYQYFSR
jgi:hypothetical protein